MYLCKEGGLRTLSVPRFLCAHDVVHGCGRLRGRFRGGRCAKSRVEMGYPTGHLPPSPCSPVTDRAREREQGSRHTFPRIRKKRALPRFFPTKSYSISVGPLVHTSSRDARLRSGVASIVPRLLLCPRLLRARCDGTVRPVTRRRIFASFDQRAIGVAACLPMTSFHQCSSIHQQGSSDITWFARSGGARTI